MEILSCKSLTIQDHKAVNAGQTLAKLQLDEKQLASQIPQHLFGKWSS